MNLTVSAMFYTDSTMHKIYIDDGSFDFTYQLPQMIYSSLISFFLEMLPNNLGLYEENILEARKRNKDSLNKIIKDVYRGIIIKIAFFFIVTYLLSIFFWIYLGCFCAVYKNTQNHLLKDVTLSFALSFISPFCIYLFPGIFRIASLRSKSHRNIMYNFSKIIQVF